MATPKQVDYVRVLQKKVGGTRSSRSVLSDLSVPLATKWIALLKLDVNPADLAEPPADTRRTRASRAHRTGRIMPEAAAAAVPEVPMFKDPSI